MGTGKKLEEPGGHALGARIDAFRPQTPYSARFFEEKVDLPQRKLDFLRLIERGVHSGAQGRLQRGE